MTWLRSFFEALGPKGAVANVEAVLVSRAREDWAVEGLELRLAEATRRRSTRAA